MLTSIGKMAPDITVLIHRILQTDHKPYPNEEYGCRETLRNTDMHNGVEAGW